MRRSYRPRLSAARASATRRAPSGRTAGALAAFRRLSRTIVITIRLIAGAALAASCHQPGALASPVVNAEAFYVRCDGHTDDTDALQAFFRAVQKDQAGSLPPGVCLFKNTLYIPANFTTIAGSGQYSTTLLYDGLRSDIDLVRVFGQSPVGVAGPATISGVRIMSARRMTAGAALHIHQVGRLVLHDIVVDGQNGNGNLWEGFWFDVTDMVRLDGFEARAQDDALRLNAGGADHPGVQYDLYVANGKIGGARIGVHMGGGFDNFHIDNVEVTNNQTNVVIDNSISPFKNQEATFGSHFTTDQALSGDNYLIDDRLADRTNYCNISIDGIVTHSYHGAGIRIRHWPNCFVSVNSPFIMGNAEAGVQIDDHSAIVKVSPTSVVMDNGKPR